MAAPKQQDAAEDENVDKAVTQSATAKVVVYDFDQTITVIHLYHELNGRGVDQKQVLSKMTDKRLKQIFGGKARIEALHRHFGALKANGVELAIISFGFVGVIKAALQRMGLFDAYFAESVIIGTDSVELDKAKGSKAVCIDNVFKSNGLKSEHIIFVDDDPYNVMDADESGVCRTVSIDPRKGMNQKHMKRIEEMAGISAVHLMLGNAVNSQRLKSRTLSLRCGIHIASTRPNRFTVVLKTDGQKYKMQTGHSLDFGIFQNIVPGDDSDGHDDVESKSLERIIEALDYYQFLLLTPLDQKHGKDPRTLFTEFCEEIYTKKVMLNDYIHWVRHHNDTESAEAIRNRLHFQCETALKCPATTRHYRDRRNDFTLCLMLFEFMDTALMSMHSLDRSGTA